MEPLVDGMKMLKENIIILSAPIDKLLSIEWAHCVDFKIGLDALYDIKETVEVLGGTIKAMGEGKVNEAVNLVLGSAALISCLELLDPELLRNMLKAAFQPPAVTQAIKTMMGKMPEELQHPFEDFLEFINELDASDLDAIVSDFAALVKQFKVKIPKQLAQMREKAAKQVKETVAGSGFGAAGREMQVIMVSGSSLGSIPEGIPDFSFPGDFLASINPIDILAMLGEKVPAPFDIAFKKALEVARFAPLMKVIDKLKNTDLEGAVAEVFSKPVLMVTKNLDLELPRKILKKLLGVSAVLDMIKEQLRSVPKEMAKPFQLLQDLAGNLDGDIDDILGRFGKVFDAFQSRSVTVSGAQMGSDGAAGFSFPLDLIKKISPVSILSLLGDKLPGPLKGPFSKVNKRLGLKGQGRITTFRVGLSCMQGRNMVSGRD